MPGHGSISTKKDLKTYLKMLTTLRSRVASEIKKGKTLEEVKGNSSITKGYESFNGWITEERIRVTIYNSLKNGNWDAYNPWLLKNRHHIHNLLKNHTITDC